MPSTVLQGNLTYTPERVLRILRAETYVSVPDTPGVPPEFLVSKLAFETTEDDVLICHTNAARAQRAVSSCQKHLDSIRNSSTITECLAALDEHHSQLLRCSFHLQKPKGLVVERVCQLLSRLPATPTELGDGWHQHYSDLHVDHFLPETPSPRTWDRLRATQFVATNTIRLAIQMECAGDTYWANEFREYVNLVAELLDAALIRSAEVDHIIAEEELVLQAFLWTSWQRAVMLHFSYLLGAHLQVGYDFNRNDALSLEIPRTLQKTLQGRKPSLHGLPSYLCRWAFESIRSDRAAVMLDFRDFFERYTQLFGSRPSRCVVKGNDEMQQWEPCNGEFPGACNRFIGKKIEDQSTHATGCPGGCPRLYWNEESYKRLTGARAVSLEDSDQFLSYCTASNRTMAVSHVWSHGQGGRPETPPPLETGHSHHLRRHQSKIPYGTGLNHCLHQRYKQISRSFGCDSYWMDTPCIPQAHLLRKEAINNINSVFANSRCTLICDMDLMQVDVSDLTLELRESILAVLLVCDWNVRAWTLLEAMRGRHNIQIICKDEQVISLRETIEDVHRRGSLALASLFATAQHLLPAQPPPPRSTPHQFLENRAKGYVSVEEAACLLGHRHASRPGDEVVIWSLLCGETVRDTPIEFWKQRMDRIVLTGFLVSSFPRVSYSKRSNRGFAWAPSRPNLQAVRDLPLSETYFADDGARSAAGLITRKGLDSIWLVTYIKGAWPSLLTSAVGAVTFTASSTPPLDNVLRRIAFRFLKKYVWGALLQATEELLTDRPVSYRGNMSGLLLVVAGSHDRESWHWRGVYEWDPSIPLPVFARKRVWLV